MKSFGMKKSQFVYLCGVAWSAISHDRHILVTDNHWLQNYHFEGDECVKSVGSCKKGNGPFQFYTPTNITVSSQDKYLLLIPSIIVSGSQ